MIWLNPFFCFQITPLNFGPPVLMGQDSNPPPFFYDGEGEILPWVRWDAYYSKKKFQIWKQNSKSGGGEGALSP